MIPLGGKTNNLIGRSRARAPLQAGVVLRLTAQIG